MDASSERDGSFNTHRETVAIEEQPILHEGEQVLDEDRGIPLGSARISTHENPRTTTNPNIDDIRGIKGRRRGKRHMLQG